MFTAALLLPILFLSRCTRSLSEQKQLQRPARLSAASAPVAADLSTGVRQRVPFSWDAAYQDAVTLSRSHTAGTGCRSLDILHCALAQATGAHEFVRSDARQIQLATAMRLPFTAL